MLIIFSSCGNTTKEKMTYPKTRKSNIKDFIFDEKIQDPYRWLENESSQETKNWIKAQNTLTDNYFSGIPFLEKIENKLKSIWNFPTQSLPITKDNILYYYHNDGSQNQAILKSKINGKEDRIIIDPNKLSSDGSLSIGGLYFSNDHKYLGYTTNKSGSDWQHINVIRLKDRTLIKDSLAGVKFSGIEWFNSGFYYKRYPEVKPDKILSNKNLDSKVYYHSLGTKQGNDILIETPFNSNEISPYIKVSKDEKILFLYGYKGTYGNSLYYRYANKKKWICLINDFTSEIEVIDKINNHIYLLTDRNSPFKKLIKINLEKPDNLEWITIIEGTKNEVLKEIKITGGRVFAHFYKDVTSLWKVFNLKGKLINEITSPGKGIMDGFEGEMNSKFTFFSFNNLVTPTTIYKYNIATNKSEIYWTSKIPFESEKYILKQEFYASADGTKIPIFICHKKDLKMDGKRPTLLYGYGGFNISIEPYFNKSNIILLENNGVYAIANIRGGGEYGQQWHQDGMLEKKQNVFDDFISAANYLVKSKITSSNYLAIQGQSNGGLLIGSVLNQQPDLFRVAFPYVGVMDMIRYEIFTIGHAWSVEYGSIKSKKHFNNIYKYSPIHNIDPEKVYPSILVYTADHDDRVVPAHSFKYAASLQALENLKYPALIRIGLNVGHGFGKPTNIIIKEDAEKWAYLFHEMNIKL